MKLVLLKFFEARGFFGYFLKVLKPLYFQSTYKHYFEKAVDLYAIKTEVYSEPYQMSKMEHLTKKGKSET